MTTTTTLEWHFAKAALPAPDRDVLVVLDDYAARRVVVARYEPPRRGAGTLNQGHRWWPQSAFHASQAVDERDRWAYVVLPEADGDFQGRLIEAVGL